MAEKSLYNAAAQEVFELFGDYIQGAFDLPFLVIAARELDPSAANAIEKSLGALGYGAPAYSLVLLNPEGAACALDDQALTLLIEGIDPLRIICTDAETAVVLEKAYREQLRLDATARFWGRSGVVFENLAQLIGTEQGKRKTWELFKTLK